MLLRRGLLAASCFLVPAAAPVVAHGQAPRARGEVRGLVVGAADAQPVAAATITVRRAGAGRDTALVGTAASRADGTFRVEGLRAGRYAVRVRALGYTPVVRPAVVADGGSVDLGRFALARVAAQLGGVQVQAQQEAATLTAGANTYQTKDLPGAAGGTAIDVLRNVPQVEVDADNNVSIRGDQNVKVQINGRPTPLKGQQLAQYLAQLPANLVAKVAVITNPSAKEDPDGAAGVINITLTQRTDLGTSGGFQAATSTSGLINPSGNIGRQQGPWTGFASLGYYHEDRSNTGSSEQVNTAAVLPTSLASAYTGSTQPSFTSGTLRGEYKLAEHDAVAADVVFNGGTFTRRNDADYVALAGAAVSRYGQTTASRNANTTGDYALAYRHIVDPERSALSVELRLNDSRPGFRSDVASAGATTLTRTREAEHNPTWRLQADWTRALGEQTKLETGVLGIRRRSDVSFGTEYYYGGVPLGQGAGSDGFVTDPAQTDAFQYRERVESAYGVLTHKGGGFELQGGLRLEQAATTFDLATPAALSTVATNVAASDLQGRHFENGYKSLFPSALVAYNIDPKQQVKASYSRRISRPDPSQLSPFVERQDAFNIFQGNPGLRPEYTDSYELGYQRSFAAGSVQLTPYYRRRPNAVRYIRTVDSSGITRGTFANVALSTSYGTDLNGNLRAGRLTLFGGGSVFGVRTDAHNVTPDVSFRGSGWNARGNVTYKVSPIVDVQAFVFYRAPQQIEGGRLRGFTWNSLALKGKLNGDQSTLTLSAQDPFNLIRFGSQTVNGPLVQTTTTRFGARALRLSYNYTFGKPPQFRPSKGDAQPAPSDAGSGGGPPG